ncbi:MAG: TrkA C-terminal domain-containing protein [Fidelibacterota bacterium]|nr:MAG: TrkA C-terminal domain-containing protein [Candidatus Neomarinimicrobiota bacterium]
MFAIITLLLVVSISILITRIATIALVHTGLPLESARFQARSAFTGSGFTTTESEEVVNHPVRRRIIMMLMMLGNAGIVTVISTFILSFVNRGESESIVPRMVLLAVGLLALWLVAHSKIVDRRLLKLIDRLLSRYTDLKVRDYSSIMHLAGEYSLVEIEVEPRDWIEGKTLAQSELGDEGIIVLGIKRADGSYLGAPHGKTLVLPKDVLIVYGRISQVEDLDKRRQTKRGDQQHEKAIVEQQKIIEEEAREDTATQDNSN